MENEKPEEKPKLLTQELLRTYTQENDCCEGSDAGQFLTIKTANGGIGLENDFFIIETERWAFDNIGELIQILQEFKTTYDKLIQ